MVVHSELVSAVCVHGAFIHEERTMMVPRLEPASQTLNISLKAFDGASGIVAFNKSRTAAVNS